MMMICMEDDDNSDDNFMDKGDARQSDEYSVKWRYRPTTRGKKTTKSKKILEA